MTSTKLAKNSRNLGPRKFLATISKGKTAVTFLKKQAIFTQGDAAGAIFFVQEGKVRQTVISRFGKKATLDILSEGEFFGDGGLAGQSLRMVSATAITDCTLLQIDKEAMMHALQRERALSDLFIAYLLARNIRYHQEIVDQLFDSSEKRLARVLLLLARFGKEGTSETRIPKVSQATLAGMAGTTQLRVRFFMKKFRNAGFLASSGQGLQIHSSLLNVVLGG